MDIIDEDICRFCFEGRQEGALISPCLCTGYQRYVHLNCLRSWQRMELVNQPTHPAFYDDDRKFSHYKCNVCQSNFTCSPPTRLELMQSFTGSELSQMVNEGYIIASREEFSLELEKELNKMPLYKRQDARINHWVRGVFLIFYVKEESQIEEIQIEKKNMLFSLLERQQRNGIFKYGDKPYNIIGFRKNGIVTNFSEEEKENLEPILWNIEAPYSLIILQAQQINCGDDFIFAVNLTRQLNEVYDKQFVEEARYNALKKYPGAINVEIQNYIGGPNDPNQIVCCLVPGGYGRGWTIVKDLTEAIIIAYGRSIKRSVKQGEFIGGQAVEIVGLKNRLDLNGQKGLTLQFQEKSGRWDVLINKDEGKSVKPENLKALEETHGRVYVFWGDARWTRTQLLGELARGSWGLCKGYIYDIISPIQDRRKGLDDRLIYSPITSMTEQYIIDQQREIQAMKQQQVQENQTQ